MRAFPASGIRRAFFVAAAFLAAALAGPVAAAFPAWAGSPTSNATKGPDVTSTTAPRMRATVAGTSTRTTTPAAGGEIAVTPGTGLVGGQDVTVTGGGLRATSEGAVIECNGAPGEPTVSLSLPTSPGDFELPVGCSGVPELGRIPKSAGLVSVSAEGNLSTAFTVMQGVVGPPCGFSYLGSCAATDSKGNAPAADAAVYPCPPTASQQAEGVSCYLLFGDLGRDLAYAPIGFASSSSTTPTSLPTSLPVILSPPTVPGPGSTTTAGAGPGSSAGAQRSGSLAFTGPGAGLWFAALAGLISTAAGIILLGIERAAR